MGLPGNLFSTAFRQQRLGVMFALIMAIMVYLGSLALAAQAVLARTSFSWGRDLETRVTVELPAVPDETGSDKAARVDKILGTLRQISGVRRVALVPEADTARLLKPWIADQALLDSLPLPVLIDLETRADRPVETETIRRALTSLAHGALVHTHAGWMESLLSFLRGLGALAGLMLGLTALALVTAIILVCRAAMAVQNDTIELLHFMGASDIAIARQFQKHVQKIALPASGIGFAFAAATAAVLALTLSTFGGLQHVSLLSWATVGGVMALVPLGAVLLSIVTARLSVLRFLRRLI